MERSHCSAGLGCTCTATGRSKERAPGLGRSNPGECTKPRQPLTRKVLSTFRKVQQGCKENPDPHAREEHQCPASPQILPSPSGRCKRRGIFLAQTRMPPKMPYSLPRSAPDQITPFPAPHQLPGWHSASGLEPKAA